MVQMLQTSKDLLFIVIAFSVLLLTIFIVSFLYYFIKIIRNVSKVVDNVQDKVEKIGSLIELCRKKVESSTGQFVILVEAIKQIVKFALEKKDKKKARERTKRKS